MAVAIDEDANYDALPNFAAVADTIGGEVAAKLVGKVKPGGCFGCFPSTRAAVGELLTLEVNVIFAQPNPLTTRRYAEAFRDRRLAIPINRVLPLAEAAQAHTLAERGARGKIIRQP